MNLIRVRFLVLCVVCGSTAFAYGYFQGRKEVLSNHLLFDMAVHCGSLAQFDKLPSDALSDGKFSFDLQRKVLFDTIKQIDRKGFTTLLNDSDTDNEDLLLKIYQKSIRILNYEAKGRDGNGEL